MFPFQWSDYSDNNFFQIITFAPGLFNRPRLVNSKLKLRMSNSEGKNKSTKDINTHE